MLKYGKAMFEDVSKVKDMALYRTLVEAAQRLNRQREYFRDVAWARAETSARDGHKRMRDADARHLRTMDRHLEDFEVVLTAMKYGGRNPERPRAEILSCFDKDGRHMSETIARRYFGRRSPSYACERWIEGELEWLVNKGRVVRDSHERTSQTVYLLVTPERQAKWKKEREERLAHQKRYEGQRARLATVLTALKALGIEAKPGRYDTTILTMDVEDIEKLIAAATKGKCA